MKSMIRNVLGNMGLEMRRINSSVPATVSRPVGVLEPFLQDLAARGFQPNHILDVGANQGEWSRNAHKSFPKAAFTLVEPQVEMKDHLDEFCASAPNSRWVNAGAGEAAGELNFTVCSDTVSSTFLGSDQTAAPGTEIRKVPVITIDSLYFDPARPTSALPQLVKLDVEGFELKVLRGASQLLQSHAIEVFMIEVAFFSFSPQQPMATEVIQFMAEQNYHLYDFSWFCRRPLDGALGLAEIAFVAEHSALRASSHWS